MMHGGEDRRDMARGAELIYVVDELAEWPEPIRKEREARDPGQGNRAARRAAAAKARRERRRNGRGTD